VVFLAAAFCAYGTIASFEPGTSLIWRIVYPALWVVCIAVLLWVIFRRVPGRQRSRGASE